MQLLTGMYTAKVDEKGRLSLPSRLRTALSSSQVVVLPGLDGNHLMLMTPDYFENQFCTQILSSPLALMDKEKRKLVRKIISPAGYRFSWKNQCSTEKQRSSFNQREGRGSSCWYRIRCGSMEPCSI